MWKWLIGLVVFVVAAVGAGGVYLTSTEGGRKVLENLKPKAKATEVRTERVARGVLVRTVSAPGQVEPRTNVKISAQVSARIVALPFREGDKVKAGDVVVRLDARDMTALLESAQASLKGEQARLEGSRARVAQARADLARTRELFSSKDVSQAVLDQAEAEHQQAEASLRAAEHSIEVARANIRRAEKDLDNTVITSPIDGTITTLDAEVGETVVVGTLNNPGSVIMEIADLGLMVLKARVDESAIAPVRAGQRAKVYINAYSERTFEGEVDLVTLKRKLDKDGTGYFEVEIPIRLSEGELIRSGLTANCEIEVETLRDVIIVPSQSVLDRRVDELPKAVVEGNQYVDQNRAYARVVFRLVPDDSPGAAPGSFKAMATPVSVGSSDLFRTVILGGLSEGDLIATGPYRVLREMKHEAKVAEEGAGKKEGE